MAGQFVHALHDAPARTCEYRVITSPKL